MAEQRVHRRLAAILVADVAGYSRLMGEDEEGTLATLTAHIGELIEPCIAEHSGRVVKTTGDGLLAEFASVVDAVRCAVAFQDGMAARNADTPADRRIEFRIGVNLGDVIVQDGDVFGDGVNVASRLEGLATPGGVIVSGKVRDEVRTKIDLGFDDLGPQAVKNIAEPIPAFRVRIPDDAGSITDRIISASPPLPDKPSIAVLPFENISGDPEQEFFADGITEDIITALSKISELLVVARNSTFVYKGRAVNVSEVARELGVGYVLEGSIRTANNRVRITAQLIEAESGHHAWAERYDRELSDIFALQDEITNEIVVALQVNLSEGEQARLQKRQTESLEAWECYVRGSRDVTSATRANKERAQELLERAVALDPDFAVAWAFLGRMHWQDARAHWTNSPETSLDKAAECAEKALAIDDTLPDAHAFIGVVRLFQKRFADAVAAGEKAVELGANSAETYLLLAQTLNYTDRAADAAALIERAMRLFPYYPDNLLGLLAVSYRILGRFEESIALDTERLKRNPDNMYSDHRLAYLYMELGREDEARRHVGEAIKKNPNTSLRQIRFSEPYQDEAYLDRYLDLLRGAGMPD